MTTLRMLLDPAGWIINQIKSASHWLFCAMGFLSICGGLVLAAFVERKELAVALTFAMTFLGTAILGLTIPKVLAAVIDDEREKSRLLAQRLEAEKAARQSQEKLRAADHEIARLERMQLSLQAFKPIANLGLLSVDMTIKDFCSKKLGPRQQPKLVGIPVGSVKQDLYVGAVEIPIKAHLGVDLHEVQIVIDPGGRLVVGGVSMSTTADTVRGAEWQLQEVRTQVFSDDTVTKIQIDPHDSRLIAERDLHENQVRERIRAGQSFVVFEKPLLQAAREVIASLLTPLGREVIFVEPPPRDATPLLSFLASEQQKLADRIETRGKESVRIGAPSKPAERSDLTQNTED